MKVLPKSARETKEQFFGKKGWTLHSVLVYTRKENSFELDIQAYDHWSNDPRQDAWFTASSLHTVIESIKKKPEWVTIISDNRGHYHNADLMMILRHWPDYHHAQIAHSINRHVKLGFDISSGKDIENAISGICRTSVSHLEPDRKKESGKGRNKLPGIFNWFEWSWPIVGEYSGYIQARDIANLGTWMSFSPKDLEKLQSKTIEKPNPSVSTPTISENSWMVLLPNNTGIQVKKLKKNHVKEQLEARGILKDIDTNKSDLAKIRLETEINSQFLFWPLACGWALKSAQKFGRKGVKNVEDGVIEEEEVPKLETIRNWIFHYASQHCQEAAIVVQASRT
ncbi:hypothetical protein GLOIN_2v1790148 [Rhizophagus clarus]|uniref:Uncharacterized protein n=1 Tax=Rhizophagus clarus TaxID=94130 RepID=A0A8H3QVE5_9GLOM|nr:hypothetical protein GLOIN_2v1790148 [Rhizophagus clarus]